MKHWYEAWVWSLGMTLGYEAWVWSLCMKLGYKAWVWSLGMKKLRSSTNSYMIIQSYKHQSMCTMDQRTSIDVLTLSCQLCVSFYNRHPTLDLISEMWVSLSHSSSCNVARMKTTFRRKHLVYDAIKYCSNANRHLIVLPDLLLPRWSCKHSLHFIYRYIIRYPPVLIMAEYDMSVCLLRSLTSYSVTVPETNRASSNI